MSSVSTIIIIIKHHFDTLKKEVSKNVCNIEQHTSHNQNDWFSMYIHTYMRWDEMRWDEMRIEEDAFLLIPFEPKDMHTRAHNGACMVLAQLARLSG